MQRLLADCILLMDYPTRWFLGADAVYELNQMLTARTCCLPFVDGQAEGLARYSILKTLWDSNVLTTEYEFTHHAASLAILSRSFWRDYAELIQLPSELFPACYAVIHMREIARRREDILRRPIASLLDARISSYITDVYSLGGRLYREL